MLDLGANTGEFSRLALEHAQRVVAVDADHDCIDNLFRSTPQAGARLHPIVTDLADLGGGRGWPGAEFAGLSERLAGQADVVMMLALTHHLCFAESIPLDEIAALAARWSRSRLIFELPHPDDPMVVQLATQRRQRAASFTVDAQLRAFSLHVAGAVALNGLLFGAALLAARLLLPPRAIVVMLRAWILLALAALTYTVLHASGMAPAGAGRGVRLAVSAGVVVAAFVLAARMGDDTGERLARAAALGCLAFVVAPFAWRAATGSATLWIGAPAAPAPRATVFLLLDEMGADAARPIAGALRQAGLNVSETRLVPAGENTQNAVPAMFSGLPFERARPCGMASVCSGTNVVDFGAVRVARPDVHVTGLLLPYCRIAGLASCFQLPLAHEQGSAYRSLAAFWLRRIGITLASVQEPPGEQRRLLALQLDFIERSRFWAEGGILCAHLPIPHPPGLDGQTTLDADYAANLDAAQALVTRMAARLHANFAGSFTLVVTSDHPLRTCWCANGIYRADACALRAHSATTRCRSSWHRRRP